MRVITVAVLALVLNYADGRTAAAQDNLQPFEITHERKREIALSIAVEAKVDDPARLRDVLGLEEGTGRIVCGHALVMNRNLMSMGYRPFAGYIMPLDKTPPDVFKLVGYGFPIGPVDMALYEECERFGFRL